MSWKYSVEQCNAETHVGICGPWVTVDVWTDSGWRDAYRKAEELPHGIVTSQYTGVQSYNKAPHKVFEHIEGGGLCAYCGKGRGPLCRTASANEFACGTCRTELRESSLQVARDLGTTPSRFSYVPIIETIDYC